MPRIGLPAGAAHAKLPTGILAVSLASEARNAHEERPLTPAASKIEEFEVVHPLARVDELDGGRAMGDSSQRASIRARGAGWSRLGPPPISPRAVRASTTSALLSRHSYRSDLDRQIPTDSSCRRHPMLEDVRAASADTMDTKKDAILKVTFDHVPHGSHQVLEFAT